MSYFRYLPLLLIVALLTSCTKSDKELANQRVSKAKQMVEAGMLNQAKIELDSVHSLYPKQVEARRNAKTLQDSIVYIEAQRTANYTDSVLQCLLPQVDEQIKTFRWEKQDKYEDKGRYVHKLLNTDRNTARCFLQCYIDESKAVILKSYYYGSKKIAHNEIRLSSAENQLHKSGANHSFEAQGWHEILTFEQQDALDILNFIAAYKNQRIQVMLQGKGTYTYFLQDSEKKALEDTYRLAVLLKDVEILEKQNSLANRQIQNYAKKH